MSRRHAALAAVLFASTIQCSDATRPGDADRTPVPSRLIVVSGDRQTGPAGETLPQPLSLRVVDDRDQPMGGVTVSFEIQNGGGALTPAVATSDANGLASSNWRLGDKAGVPQTALARVSTPRVIEAPLEATASAGPPAELRAETSVTLDGTAAAATPPISVSVRDVHGNAVAGVAVSFALPDGSSVSVTSDTAGVATLSIWILPTLAGSYQVIARSGGLASVSFTVRAHAGAPARLDILGDRSLAVAAGQTAPAIRVRAVDGSGNAVSGVSVRFTLNGASLADAVSDSTGIATLTWVAPSTTGAYVVEATVGSVPPARVDVTIFAPFRIQFVNVPALWIASTTPLSVQVTDLSGYALFGVAINWSVVSGVGAFSPTLSTADGGGVAISNFVTGQKSGYTRLRVSSGAVSRDTVVFVQPGPLHHFSPGSQDLSLRVGTSFTQTVVARDIAENPIPGLTLTSRIGNAGLLSGSMTPASVTTDTSGRATFSMVVAPWTGPNYFEIDSPFGLSAGIHVRGFSDQGNLVPTAIGPTSAKVGSKATYWIMLFDANGFPVAGEKLTYSVAPGNGTIAPYNPIGIYDPTNSSGLTSNPEGLGMVDWSFPSTPGTYHMTVTAPSIYRNNPYVYTVTVVP